MEYGTSGFRDRAFTLPHVMYRMGLLAVLRSKAKNGASIGVMVTASHNPEEDNGVKLIDPSGEMLESKWENLASELVNAKDDDLKVSLESIVQEAGIDNNHQGSVLIARDTRSSSPQLAKAVVDGAETLGGLVEDFGLLTTPQLHYIICCRNSYKRYGVDSAEGYYKKLTNAFHLLEPPQGSHNLNYLPHLSVDGANGIGAYKLKEMIPYLNGALKIDIFNDGSSGKLNYQCGADFVKISQKPPEGTDLITGHRYASFDGDADRLIYFYLDDNKVFHMLDGDKMATLIAQYIKNCVEATKLDLELHVVQTAYANGSSTNYIQNVLKIPVSCVSTGVKYLHHEAKKFDIGVYFEANGHGTVLFSENAKNMLKEASSEQCANEEQRKAAHKLLNVIDLINETVGDAISDMLLVEAILRDQSLSISDWDSLYVDLPNRQLKAKVPDRRVICTTDAARVCTKPEGLQDAISALLAKYNNARTFVRPSGTEDIVRIYAEADTQDNADLLAQVVREKMMAFIMK